MFAHIRVVRLAPDTFTSPLGTSKLNPATAISRKT